MASTRNSSLKLRLREISAAKRRKVPSGRPPARPTVQLLTLATVLLSPLDAAVGARDAWARSIGRLSAGLVTCADAVVAVMQTAAAKSAPLPTRILIREPPLRPPHPTRRRLIAGRASATRHPRAHHKDARQNNPT